MSARVRAEIVAEYEVGVGVVEIARRRGIAKTTVIEQLNRASVVRRSRSMSPEQISEAEAIYRSGLSLQRIGDRLGFTARTVRARLLERGVPMRDTQGRIR